MNFKETKLSLHEDLHIHSTFSDGTGTLSEICDQAIARDLDRICFADHVRRDTAWVPDYLRAVRALRQTLPIQVLCGVEAKILNEDGDLDLPAAARACDVILVADHRLPFEDRCLSPIEARRLLRTAEATPERLIEGLIRATCKSLNHGLPTIVAHLFSILPKIGLSETLVESNRITELADYLLAHQAVVEISERWHCPGERTLDILTQAGVPLVASTDSHAIHSVGRFDYVKSQAERLRALEHRKHGNCRKWHSRPTPQPYARVTPESDG